MVDTAKSASPCGCRFGLKPLTASNILYYYAPLQGALSYTALSVNVMNPTLVFRLFPRRDITNVLLINSLVGSALFLYSRPHLRDVPTQKRVLLCAFGAVSFSLGSVLIWAILRSIVPQNLVLSTVCGISSGLALMKIGRTYTEHVDSLVPNK